MSAADWLAILGGMAAIALVNWWFFLAERPARGAEDLPDGVQQVEILVWGGYQPARIRARAGRPLRLVFDRQETSACSEEIVFPDFDLRRFLPAFRKTTIELTPARAGKYEFTCGMSMLRGTLEVE